MAPNAVLITGANRGIGLALVKEFLKNSEVKHVFAGTRNLDQATDLKVIDDSRLHVIQLDVDCDDSIARAFAEVDSIVGEHGLNVLINNAAVFPEYNVRDAPNRKLLNQVFNTNTAGVAVVSQIFLPLLQRASKRVTSDEMSFDRAANLIISTGLASIADNKKGSGQYHNLAYRLSKTAVNQLARTLAIDFASDHIFTAAYNPGWVLTEIGGPQAEITPEESASGLIATWKKLTKEQNGGYFRRNGDVFPY